MAERPTHPTYDMGQHPDIAALRARYDLAAQSRSGQSVSGLAFLSGLYLAISPWVVGFFGRTTLTVNNLVTGIALALLAAGISSAYGRIHGLAWVVPIIGIWTIIAPWVLPPHGASVGMIISNVVTGAVITACGLATVTLGTMSTHRG
ncbi:SPW repeat protein [Nonomuraea sp. NPDC049784]|uniref:SPW repeat protein n=1 Tax=Nonomuraea sp. NPDC049784 TaxID=3154361 RepID=UPI0033FF054E